MVNNGGSPLLTRFFTQVPQEVRVPSAGDAIGDATPVHPSARLRVVSALKQWKMDENWDVPIKHMETCGKMMV